MQHHNYTSNMIDTITVAIKAGTNLELGSRAFDYIVSQSTHPSPSSTYIVRTCVSEVRVSQLSIQYAARGWRQQGWISDCQK